MAGDIGAFGHNNPAAFEGIHRAVSAGRRVVRRQLNVEISQALMFMRPAGDGGIGITLLHLIKGSIRVGESAEPLLTHPRAVKQHALQFRGID